MTKKTYKVVQNDPKRAMRRRGLFLVLTVGVPLLAYWVGVHEARYQYSLLEQRLERDQARLEHFSAEYQVCRQSLAVTKKRSELDRLASERVRHDWLALKDQVARHQEDIAFYQKVMDGKKSRQRLKVEKVAFVPDLMPGHYRYQIVLMQIGKKHPWTKGRLVLTVTGLIGGKPKKLTVKSTEADGSAEEHAFRFRYFQKLEGELQLPEGFKPEFVQVRLESEGRSPLVVEDQFSWSNIKGA